MSAFLDQLRVLVQAGNYVVSQHGARRLLTRSIDLDDVATGLATAETVEGYPDYFAGPAVLVLCSSPSGTPLHALWGLMKGTTEPAVLITAYLPDPAQWSADFRIRKP